MVRSGGAEPRLCIWCPRVATSKAGEHLFDDWLNRRPRPRHDRYTFHKLGRDDTLIRTYVATRIDSTMPVVCDACNNGWMSDLTHEFKKVAGDVIASSHSTFFDDIALHTIAAFLFMKAAATDANENWSRCVRRRRCVEFASSLVPPAGTQVWGARYVGPQRFSAFAWHRVLDLRSGPHRGFSIFVFTYVVNHFALQLSYPRWTKNGRAPALPFLTQHEVWDLASVPIWPQARGVVWPPPTSLDREQLDVFCERFAKLVRRVE